MKTEDDSPPSLAFERFYRDAWPQAYRLACLLTQDAAAGEEIAQDVLAQMYTTWGRAERPHAYLRTSVINRSHNWHRRGRVQQAALPLVATPASVDFAADDLADAVAALPFRQRAVLVLRYYLGLTEAEIAEALGCRPGTVKSSASRALNQLQKVVER